MKSIRHYPQSDEPGRIVLPIELRRSLGIARNRNPLEIFVQEDNIGFLRKYSSGLHLSADRTQDVEK